MPIIQDDDELDHLLDKDESQERSQSYGPSLPIAYGIARFSYLEPSHSTLDFLFGDRIAIFDDLDGLYWLGKNTRTDTVGKFPYFYLLEEIPNYGEDGVIPGSTLQTVASINAKEVERVQRNFRHMFGTELDVNTVFKVLCGMPHVQYWDRLHSFSMIFPQTTSWISIFIIEIESFRSFLYQKWRLVPGFSWWKGQQFGFEEIEKGFKSLIFYGHRHSAWNATLTYCTSSLPTLEGAWVELRSELQQIEDHTGLFEISKSIMEVDEIIGTLRSSLELMLQKDDEAKNAAQEQTDDPSLAKPLMAPFDTMYPYEPYTGGTSSPEPLSMKERLHYTVARYYSRTTSRLGSPSGVLSTVSSLAILGGITTAVATWKCDPPDEFPTIDSNFWSTLASAALGTAGLFCTIIPILRNQQIKVSNERLFHRLLWASLFFAIAASVVYLYQTRASLVLLFLSSAAQLATTLQIINGAVQKIEEDSIEISGLKARLDRR